MPSVSKGYKLIRQSMGDWWKDDRKKWCAYCGIPMKLRCASGATVPPHKSTRDHIIPKKYTNNRKLTIPACRSCNQAKGQQSLAEFMAGEHFEAIRKIKHRHKWTDESLWTVAGMAALENSVLASGKK
ncbi:MAG: HNH endonuclease [Rhizobiaceae bacterium]